MSVCAVVKAKINFGPTTATLGINLKAWNVKNYAATQES
jgi:hypothetical protein